MERLSSNSSRTKRLGTKKIFIEIIDFHIKTQGIFADVADIMSATIFLQLLSGIIFAASVFFQIDLVSVHYGEACAVATLLGRFVHLDIYLISRWRGNLI